MTNDVYELRIECVGGAYWENTYWFTVEVPSTISLTGLSSLILSSTKFSNDHGYEFYSGRNHRNKKVSYPAHSDDYFSLPEIEDNPFELDTILLKDIYPLPKSCKLYYMFDYGDSWIFEIRKSRKKIEIIKNRNYPYFKTVTGKSPQQYPDHDE